MNRMVLSSYIYQFKLIIFTIFILCIYLEENNRQYTIHNTQKLLSLIIIITLLFLYRGRVSIYWDYIWCLSTVLYLCSISIFNLSYSLCMHNHISENANEYFLLNCSSLPCNSYRRHSTWILFSVVILLKFFLYHQTCIFSLIVIGIEN